MSNYKQLVEPNRSVVGRIYLCLKYVDDVFGVPAQGMCPSDGSHQFSARDMWDVVAGKHTERTMPNAAVPVFFSWQGVVDGVFKDWGHVVWYDPNDGTFTSSPMDYASDWKIFKSIQEVERFLGAAYLGWSECLGRPGHGERRLVELVAEAAPEPSPTPAAESYGERVAQDGTMRVDVDGLNVRRSPSLSGEVVASYSKGQTFRYDSYVDAEGYRWVSYVGRSGNRNYVARRKLDGSEVFGECY